MTDVTGSDIPQGQEIKWYSGGEMYSETLTDPASDTAVALTKTAEMGSVICLLDGVPAAVTEFQSDGSTAATDATGTEKIKIAGANGSKDALVYYIDNETTGLTHIASCQDVKFDATASVKTAAVHGQSAKLNVVGALEMTAELEELYYSQNLVKVLMGSQISNSPASGKEKWTTKGAGSKKIGALIGKRYDSSANVIFKIFLIGVQATGLSGTFPTEDMYKRSFKMSVDYVTECSCPV